MGINKINLRLIKRSIDKWSNKGNMLSIGVQRVKPSLGIPLQQHLKVSKLDTISIDPKESPTFLKDLNYDIGILTSYLYDIILDGGSLEHCINPTKVVFNILNNINVGGIIIHYNPFNGWKNHGFFSFTKNFYECIYNSNGAEILEYATITPPNKKTKLLNWVVAKKVKPFVKFSYPVEGKYL